MLILITFKFEIILGCSYLASKYLLNSVDVLGCKGFFRSFGTFLGQTPKFSYQVVLELVGLLDAKAELEFLILTICQ